MRPLVSAIITTHNRKELLLKAIKSVLNQTYNYIELIVVDDASTDGSKLYIESHIESDILNYIYIEKSKGGNHARNVGISMAKGDFIAFLDDDDEWLETKIAKQINYLLLHPNYDVVSCARIFEYDFQKREKMNINDLPNGGDMKQSIWCTLAFVTSTLMFRTEFLKKIGMFDEQLKCWQDYELMIRSAQSTNIGVIKEYLVLYRSSNNDKHRLSTNLPKWESSVEYINKKHKDLIDKLPSQNLNGYLKNIAIDGLCRTENKISKKKYLKLLYKAEPTLKNLIKYILNIKNLQFLQK